MSLRDFRQLVVAASSVILDRKNRAVYGMQAPRVAELIWINPSDVNRCINVLPRPLTSRNCSGVVIDYRKSGIEEGPLLEQPQVRSSFAHWCDGVPWENTEDFCNLVATLRKFGKAVGCRSERDLRLRFAQLDQLFETTLRSGAFKTQKQLRPWNFREFGGILISINAEGMPVLNKAGGYHRLAIARILQLKVVPAALGLIDKNAIELLPQLREAACVR